ncbi:MAG: acyl-CoA dehydrogenase family protein [Solirubrobacteraceae bacterium]
MTVAQAMAVLRERGPDRDAEIALLGGWLLERAGLGTEAAQVTVVPGGARDSLVLADGHLSGTAHRVPWARDAAAVALLLDGRVLVVDCAAVAIHPHANLAGDARDAVVFERAPARSGRGVDAEELFMRGALTRIALMAGALDRVYEIAVRHAGDRRQFGRPIGSFQAVQQHLVTIAQQAALLTVAADAAARRPGGFEIAAGKLLANRAALSAGRAAHQVLGARGTTREHPLGQLTCRLWAWRSEYGDEHRWSTRLGAAVARAGADSVYPAITGGSTVVSV